MNGDSSTTALTTVPATAGPPAGRTVPRRPPRTDLVGERPNAGPTGAGG
jgi:hypothetical protein